MIKFIVFIISISFLLPCLSAAVKIDSKKDSGTLLELYVRKIEREYKLPTGLLHTLILIESNYYHLAINPKSAKRGVGVTSYGLGQLTEATAKNICNLQMKDIYDPYKNLNCAAKVIKYQYTRYNYDITKAVSAYNAGTPCICNGYFYVRQWHKEWDDSKNVCYKSQNKEATCTKLEVGRYLNQDYVDKFYALWTNKK